MILKIRWNDFEKASKKDGVDGVMVDKKRKKNYTTKVYAIK